MCHFNLIVSFLIIALHQHLLEEGSTDKADFHFYPDPSLCFDWGAHTNLTNTQGFSPAFPVSLEARPVDGTMPCPVLRSDSDHGHPAFRWLSQRVGSGSPQNTVHKISEISQWQNSRELRPLGNFVLESLSPGSEPFLWTFQPVKILHNRVLSR